MAFLGNTKKLLVSLSWMVGGKGNMEHFISFLREQQNGFGNSTKGNWDFYLRSYDEKQCRNVQSNNMQ